MSFGFTNCQIDLIKDHGVCHNDTNPETKCLLLAAPYQVLSYFVIQTKDPLSYYVDKRIRSDSIRKMHWGKQNWQMLRCWTNNKCTFRAACIRRRSNSIISLISPYYHPMSRHCDNRSLLTVPLSVIFSWPGRWRSGVGRENKTSRWIPTKGGNPGNKRPQSRDFAPTFTLGESEITMQLRFFR